MYVLIAQLYWPVWLLCAAFGHTYIGMMLGVIAVVTGWMIAWRIEFKTWRFLE